MRILGKYSSRDVKFNVSLYDESSIVHLQKDDEEWNSNTAPIKVNMFIADTGMVTKLSDIQKSNSLN